MRKFYVVLELSDDDWEGTPTDLAVWLEGSMNSVVDADGDEIEATVYASIGDLNADHVLDSLAGIA